MESPDLRATVSTFQSIYFLDHKRNRIGTDTESHHSIDQATLGTCGIFFFCKEWFENWQRSTHGHTFHDVER